MRGDPPLRQPKAGRREPPLRGRKRLVLAQHVLAGLLGARGPIAVLTSFSSSGGGRTAGMPSDSIHSSRAQPSCGRGARPPPPRPLRARRFSAFACSPLSFFATSPISSQFRWSLVSARTTHSAATSCGRRRLAHRRAISIALTSDSPMWRTTCARASPSWGRARALKTSGRIRSWFCGLLEILLPLLLQVLVLRAADGGLVDLDAALLGLERLVEKLVYLFDLHLWISCHRP